MKKALLGLVMALMAIPALADDFGIWTDAGFSQKLGETGLSVDGELGFRANNNLKNVDRWSAGIGLGYDITSFLEASVGYTFIYGYNQSQIDNKYKKDADGKIMTWPNGTPRWEGYNENKNYWRCKNRFMVNLKGKAAVGRWSFSLRERYQLTGYNSASIDQAEYRYNAMMDPQGNIEYQLKSGYPKEDVKNKKQKTKHYLRSRLEAEYNIAHCAVDPYAAFEVSNNLAGGFATEKRRWSIGADWKISKGKHFSFGYVYNNGNDDDEDGNLHAIELSYKVKGLFSKHNKTK